MAALVGISAGVTIISLLGAAISGGVTADYAFSENYGAGLKAASFFTILFIILAFIALIFLTVKAVSLSRTFYQTHRQDVQRLWQVATTASTPVPLATPLMPVVTTTTPIVA